MPYMKLKREESGLRHYLDGKPVHAGTQLEYFDIETGKWETGRYEWSFSQVLPPYLVVTSGAVVITIRTRLRWPKS